MTPKKQLEIIQLYANLMEEVKVRINAINAALSGKVDVPSPLVREFCFLQIRMICEITALSCLTAHGDTSPKLKKEYSAEKIMEMLEDLNPHFYPKPLLQTKLGPHNYHYDNRQPDFITKEELLSLYGKCGDVLHKGSLRKLLKPQSPVQYNWPEIVEPTQKIFNLLSLHRIHLYDGEWQLLCMLQNKDDNNRVQAMLAQAHTFPELKGSDLAA